VKGFEANQSRNATPKHEESLGDVIKRERKWNWTFPVDVVRGTHRATECFPINALSLVQLDRDERSLGEPKIVHFILIVFSAEPRNSGITGFVFSRSIRVKC
jgi:hypothetical protein